MKNAILLLFLLIQIPAATQQFTKITTGPAVNDAGDSRSVNWIDYDNDGDQDLFITNGPQAGGNNFLYENKGGGVFEKIDTLIINKDLSPSDGSSWGDIDNDGDQDLFVATWYNKKNYLYINNGDKTFTLSAGIISNDPSYSESGTWGDYNNDGLVDLYVLNSAGLARNFLYRNDGSGNFTKISTGPQSTDQFLSRNADWIDINGDGYTDLFVVNESDQGENVYLNNKSGSFTRSQVPVLTSSAGNSTSSDWADVDNDGDLDVFITNYAGQRNYLMLNNGDNTFTKSNQTVFESDPAYSFCGTFGDIDNDGDADLFVTNAFSNSVSLTDYLYINDGNGNFTRSSEFSSVTGWSYGASFGDYDADGYLDLAIAKCQGGNENNALYKNNGGSNNSIQFRLEGKRVNRSGIGALIKVKSIINGFARWQIRRIAGQNGYCSQNLIAHFGIGNATAIDSAIVVWPNGAVQNLSGLQINAVNTVIEDSNLVTDINEDEIIPAEIRLDQNYPNPFNPETIISFSIPERSTIKLSIFDISGKEVEVLYDGEIAAGSHRQIFNAANLASGIYFCMLITKTEKVTMKMTLLK